MERFKSGDNEGPGMPVTEYRSTTPLNRIVPNALGPSGFHRIKYCIVKHRLTRPPPPRAPACAFISRLISKPLGPLDREGPGQRSIFQRGIFPSTIAAHCSGWSIDWLDLSSAHSGKGV